MKTIILWFLVFLVWTCDGRAQMPCYEGKTVRRNNRWEER